MRKRMRYKYFMIPITEDELQLSEIADKSIKLKVPDNMLKLWLVDARVDTRKYEDIKQSEGVRATAER